MLNKKGKLTVKEIIEIVLAAAAVFVLAVLFYNLISPTFDKEKKTGESYYDEFLGQVAVADSGGTGEFSMWQVDDEYKFYLVYFGDRKDVSKRFFFLDNRPNKFCICSEIRNNGETACSSCGFLNHPALMNNDEVWAIGEEYKVGVVSKGDYYEITKI